MKEKPEVLSSKLVHRGWFNVFLDRLKLKGVDDDYKYTRYETGSGVVVLPFLDMETLLLAEQYRYGADEFFLEPIKGGISLEDKSIEDAARRELLEETGYTGDLYFLSRSYPTPAFGNLKLDFYFATNLKKIQEPELDKFESLNLVEKDYDEVLNLVDSDQYVDGDLRTTMDKFHRNRIHHIVYNFPRSK